MSESGIDITTAQRKLILDLLGKYLPNTSAWAYGSRVTWKARPQSDLDMVVFATPEQAHAVANLKEAFEESDLPFRVDLFAWHEVPEQFQKNIMAEHVVLVEQQVVVLGENPLTFGSCAQEVRNTVRPDDIPQVPYIGLEHIEQNTLHLNGFGTSTDVKSIKSTFSHQDILFGKLRPYFRKIVLAPFDGVCSTDIWVVRATQGVDQKFLFYWMASKVFIDFSMQGAEGTKMPRAKWEHVSRHQIPFVSLSEQRAIAHILGSLDDKIALNRRMNATLEGMAQALFKSWFVDFDPVIDKALAAGNPIPEPLQARAAVRESLGDARKPLPENIQGLFPDAFEHTEEMGWVPMGWGVSRLEVLCDILNGFAFKSSEYVSTGLFVLRTKNFSNMGFVERLGDDVYLPENYIKKYDNFICSEFDCFLVVFCASIGKISTIYKNCLPSLRNQNMWCFRAKSHFKSKFYINNLIQRIIPEHTQIASGSARDFFRKEDFKKIHVLNPPPYLLQVFEEKAHPIYEKISINHLLIDNLASIRDNLLSKLLSGELRVPDAEKFLDAL